MFANVPPTVRIAMSAQALSLALPLRWQVNSSLRWALAWQGAVAVLLMICAPLPLLAGPIYPVAVLVGGGGLVFGLYVLSLFTRRSWLILRDRTLTLGDSGFRGFWHFHRNVRTFGQIRSLRLHVSKVARSEGHFPAVIEVQCRGIQNVWFAADYPADLLRSVAELLASRLGMGWEELPCEGALPVGFVLHEDPYVVVPDEDTCDAPAPEKVAIRSELHSGPPKRLILQIPPGGSADHSAGLAAGLGILSLFFAFMGLILITQTAREPRPAVVLLPVAGLLGAAVAFPLSYRLGRRSARIEMTESVLVFAQESILGDQQEQMWLREQVRAVRVHSRKSKNNYTVLIVELSDGSKQELLAGRDHAELLWLATVMREHLGVPPVAGEKAAR